MSGGIAGALMRENVIASKLIKAYISTYSDIFDRSIFRLVVVCLREGAHLCRKYRVVTLGII